jgi:preprotein translocase subunit YajC
MKSVQNSAGYRLSNLTAAIAIAWMSVTAVAQDAPPVPADTPSASTSAAPGQASSPFMSLMPFVLVFAIMYFLMIRPQQKRMKEHKNLLESLKKGDDVVTTSGFIGTISGITDKVVTLELADNVRVKMLKSQISQVVKGNINDAKV